MASVASVASVASGKCGKCGKCASLRVHVRMFTRACLRLDPVDDLHVQVGKICPRMGQVWDTYGTSMGQVCPSMQSMPDLDPVDDPHVLVSDPLQIASSQPGVQRARLHLVDR